MQEKFKHLYQALQLIIGRMNDVPWYEVSDRDIQSWIAAAQDISNNNESTPILDKKET